MKAFLNMLLLIALLVQLPFSAFSAYSDLNHSHAKHQTAGNSDHDHSHTHDAPHSACADDCTNAGDCITHHHCTGTHLSSLPQSVLQQPIVSSRQSFGASADTLLSSAAHTRIDRPNWATL